MVVAEILMVRKYCDAINFFEPIESGVFCLVARCNASVLQLNWYGTIWSNVAEAIVIASGPPILN